VIAVLGDYWYAPLLFAAGAPLASVLYLWLRLLVLRRAGVPKDELAKWAKEASSSRVVLAGFASVRAARSTLTSLTLQPHFTDRVWREQLSVGGDDHRLCVRNDRSCRF
jgi:hypothetical protein